MFLFYDIFFKKYYRSEMAVYVMTLENFLIGYICYRKCS